MAENKIPDSEILEEEEKKDEAFAATTENLEKDQTEIEKKNIDEDTTNNKDEVEKEKTDNEDEVKEIKTDDEDKVGDEGNGKIEKETKEEAKESDLLEKVPTPTPSDIVKGILKIIT